MGVNAGGVARVVVGVDAGEAVGDDVAVRPVDGVNVGLGVRKVVEVAVG